MSPENALAQGVSHWDRLPRELKDLVLGTAGLFTRLLCNNVLQAELPRCAGPQLEALWAETVRVEWGGDLYQLPRPPESGNVFLGIRSRDMFQRVRTDRLAPVMALQRVAIRNRWDDLIEFGAVQDLALAASAEGAVHILEDVIKRRGATGLQPELAEAAADGGHLEAARWLHEQMPRVPWPAQVGDRAAGSGRLDVVMFLYTHRRSCVTQTALRSAASSGHLDVVHWLVKECGIECGSDAIRVAAREGHLSVLAFLGQQFPEMLGAENVLLSSNLDVLKWLHARRLLTQAGYILDGLIHAFDLAAFSWLCETFDLSISRRIIQDICCQNKGLLLRWGLKKGKIVIDADMVAVAVNAWAIQILDVMIGHDPGWLEPIATAVARRRDWEMVEWLLGM
ncbi:hypothetical protein HK105_209428 [Polyrhizophydium stewartii]|uniref:Ankyrin repeat protein n=1 Tax=Polyrhizophydium stewartii TaxID=2732419 RepID=A0ABR4MV39_9FUNG